MGCRKTTNADVFIASDDEWVVIESDGAESGSGMARNEPSLLPATDVAASRSFELIETDEAATMAYGFRVTVTSDDEYTAGARREAAAAAAWDKLGSAALRRSRAVEDVVLAWGIPPHARPTAWPVFSSAEALQLVYTEVYAKLASADGDAWVGATAGSADVARIDGDRAQIELDLRRTFPTNEFFASQAGLDSLRTILVAFARWSPIGYCQSLNYVAGLLRVVLGSDELAFWSLVHFVEDELLGYYTEGMSLFKADSALIGELLAELEPEASAVIDALGFDLSIVTAPWLLCLYVNTLPLAHVLHVWDMVMYSGASFLIRVALALLSAHAPLITAASDDFEAVYLALTQLPLLPPPHALVAAAATIDLGPEFSTRQREKLAPGELPQLCKAIAAHRAHFAL
ncbi:TBC domain-containing protein [Thecamonas trahens ATCC 50062]|uniref:TBC domain-containing protein n=1 Tax=Thecamonas trahens ATCC 50062 TaxID=461836 RepID=A0A0L0DPV5_THETB|nr:TBC domain-containing protein [Thecamonas trahens ATCC 50062]KNC54295.1 TBC domain-containing protein [Thecamonas trahens ATCC 50062]|eukprot:XP_013753759.1 TBC domain-containing protein [Thecamonas trahens ATCC 50062]